MKKLILFCLVLIICGKFNAQDWRMMMNDPQYNFYDIQKAANKYFKEHIREENERARKLAKGKAVAEEEEEAGGYEQWKRWEAFMEPRVYPTGDISLPSSTWKNYEKFLVDNNLLNNGSGNRVVSSNMTASTTWTAMGPFGAMTGSACGLPRKAGRDNFITFSPTINTTYWVGSPAGGLWKTTNDGVSWSTTTDNLSVIGCSDLAIDPTNPSIMYLATGDGDAGDTYCIGVLKSTDGGSTWNATGLTWTVNQQRTMRRLIINPNNPQILIAASSAGIWRTINGGTNWTQVSTIDAYDAEFKPGNPNVVYAGGGATGTTHSFYRSVNGGASFTVVNNGIPTTGCTRINIAVTPADTNYVYVLRSNTAYNFGGLYRSTVGGTLFTTQSTSPDVICNACTGVASGNGQGWYDLALCASPLNKDEVVAAGVNHWRSTDGGVNWTNIGCWNSTGTNPPYVHADVHEVQFSPAGVLYSCNDGGTYKWTGTAWPDLSSPRNIAQQYRIGLSGTTADYWITGHQDNGSNIFNGTTYNARQCGDGMDCFIDRTNNNNAFCSGPNGNYYRSTNAGVTWSGATTGLTGGTYWVSPWHQDPVTAATLYSSRQQLFKSTNLGVSWAQAGTIAGSASQAVIEFAIAPSNNDVIYVIHGNTGIYKTTNATAATPTWAVTGALPGGTQANYICVKATDPNTAWVCYSGYTSGTKVYKTTNGGTTWTNISTNLPNLPANVICYEPGSNDRVWVGMDVGVYYLDNSTTSWTLYNAGLPNVPVYDLEMSPAAPGKLYAATYGRGTYKVDVPAALPPTSSFSVAAVGLCTGTNVQFTDQSVNAPTSWSWSVTPGAGVTVSTPTLQNPTMNFTNPGTYTVTMQASNGVGPGSVATNTVTIAATPTVNMTSTSQTVCAGSPVTFSASGAATYSWSSGGGTGANATYTPVSTSIYTVTGTTSGCSAVRTATATVNALPTVSVTGVNAICIGNSLLLTGTGASTYTWSTGPIANTISVSPTVTTTYSVAGTGANGCTNTSSKTITVNPLPVISTTSSSSVICSGQNASLIASGASTYTWMPGSLTGATVTAAPATNTTYTVTGTDANGCVNTAVRSITVNALPTVSATVSSSVLCAGQSATLTATGASSYTWNPGNVTGNPVAFAPTVNTTYSVIGIGTNGCSNTASKTVTVNPLPSVSANTSNSIICGPPYQGTTTLNAGGASTYTWMPGNVNSTSVSVSPSVTTTYSVIGTSAANCNNTAMITVSVSTCAGIQQVVNAGGYAIYPNPTFGKLTIEFNVEKSTAINAEIYDEAGKMVLRQQLNYTTGENSQIVNIAHLANGLYFIKLTNSDNKTETIRIVKE